MTTSRRTRTRLTAVEKQATHKFEDGKTSPFDWREHWVGMPAFVQKDTSDSRLRCYADKVWIRTGEPLNPRYPVYIISKGRWSTLHTARALSHAWVCRSGLLLNQKNCPDTALPFVMKASSGKFLLLLKTFQSADRAASLSEISFGSTRSTQERSVIG